VSGTDDYDGPEAGADDWASRLNERFGAVETDVRALADRIDGLESSGGGGSGVPVADRPMHGFWPHGWYFDNDTPSGGTAAIEPVIDHLGRPRIVQRPLNKTRWRTLTGENEHMVTQMAPSTETPWDHLLLRTWFFPWGDEDDPGEDTVRAQPGEDRIERRRPLFEKAANGAFVDRWRRLFEVIDENDLADKILIRLASEFNGVGSGQGWYPDSAVGNEELWRESFRRYVETAWEVTPEVLVCWCPSMMQDLEIAEQCFPGEEYVDYVAVSGVHDSHNLYGDSEVTEELFDRVWKRYREGRKWGNDGLLGYDRLAEWSEEYDLPIAFSEWGLNHERNKWSGNDNPWLFRRLWEWCGKHNVHWQTEFEEKWFDGALVESDGEPNEKVSRGFDAYTATFSTGTDTDWVDRYRETIDYSARPTLS
jgi:hypothetical protein